MTIITFPGEEIWASPRWAFARLARSSGLFLHNPYDLEVLENAVGRDRLSFPQLEPACARRIATALRQGAAWLREELIAESSGDEAEEELAMSLTPLSTQLSLMLTNQRPPVRRPVPPPDVPPAAPRPDAPAGGGLAAVG